jgi:hypothetical protein
MESSHRPIPFHELLLPCSYVRLGLVSMHDELSSPCTRLINWSVQIYTYLEEGLFRGIRWGSIQW